ncbi:5-formyltetrahydrofolate cyclo-ligase [Streptococcus macacae]|uniref:5-formyltetrahydrofolate cyclo-ligase n=1 Tax=Streptococcus macacae NCTC 11558 TaxID=764298 RepID=G5JWC5_9STRE|nr:5-formyltetrahydrofolate cyclo-ligase [Streptococcus macacae]EHJ52340.1 5-formyltetrahydrofolate cyclo-ligase [Streptococcus macacae NCTC 11558]SUN77779.1 putative 5-formyltetrahydrofolate cyclo-ligase [Streptococcus macacae NCTC 11558]
MDKKENRANIIRQLKEQEKSAKELEDKKLLAQFLQLESYKKAQFLATYLAFPFEFDTSLLIEQAQKDGKQIVVPKTYPKGQMIFVIYDANDLQETTFGLKEPKNEEAVPKSLIDLIHVPGLGFNELGYRIGYGGGYYDRYLSDFQGETVSTIYSFQQFTFEPSFFDIPVKEVLVSGDL